MQRTRRDFLGSLGAAAGTAACGSLMLPAQQALAQASESDYRPIFDGKTLKGWHAIPRIYLPKDKQHYALPAKDIKAATHAWHEARPHMHSRLKHLGEWKVDDGAIVGTQVPKTGLGAYLLSDETFDDFELSIEASPDWLIDTGIMVRCHEIGSIGFQVLVDHRPDGSIGGIYGNSLGGFRSFPFVINGDEGTDKGVKNLREGTPHPLAFKSDASASVADFLKVWKPNDWNHFKIRCKGELPVIETWINGLFIARVDTSKLAEKVKDYDPDVIRKRLGRRGHIGLEVHDNGKMGRNRWVPGGVCRYRNIGVKAI